MRVHPYVFYVSAPARVLVMVEEGGGIVPVSQKEMADGDEIVFLVLAMCRVCLEFFAFFFFS